MPPLRQCKGGSNFCRANKLFHPEQLRARDSQSKLTTNPTLKSMQITNPQKNEPLYDWPCAGAALAVGFFAGLIDFHSHEPQAAAGVLLVLGSLLGFARPTRMWRWGVIIALGIPAVYLAGRAMGYTAASWPQPNIFASLLALIPAMIGVYGGAIVRRVSGRKSAGVSRN